MAIAHDADGGGSVASGTSLTFSHTCTGSLFSDPDLVGNLDRFFLLAKKTAENPNPSGTGYIVSLLGQGQLMIHNPVLGTGMQIGGAALARLLQSPPFVRALTKGFTVPVGNKLMGAAVAAEISRAVDHAPLALPTAADSQQPTPATRGQR